jgi:hypothetical protein
MEQYMKVDGEVVSNMVGENFITHAEISMMATSLMIWHKVMVSILILMAQNILDFGSLISSMVLAKKNGKME